MIEFGRRIVGSTVVAATAHGKHLLLHFSNDWTLRTHLQMTGAWHLYEPGEKWRKTPGKARVIIETSDHVAVCFAAPTVQLAPRRLVAERVAELGPDLMVETDFATLARRVIEERPGEAICNAIVDQGVIAGLGNVFKSELLFLERVHPDHEVGRLGPDSIESLLRRGHELLNANRGKPRTTTGDRRPGRMTWVYGRSGKPCRRCGTIIEFGERGPLARHTYWCPRCQPAPAASP